MPPVREETRTETISRLRPFVKRAKRFSGWDFADLGVRSLGKEPPWDYERRARELSREAPAVLDMGTGGGEVFSRILRGSRGRAVATEEWAVNAPIAAGRLALQGASVVRGKSRRSPFRDGAFGLVLNRHEELDPAEVARVLAPGGRVLTQQVGRDNWRELRAYFPRMADFGPLFEEYRAGFEAAGLRSIRAATHETRVVYPGLGEVVFMLCVAPWEIPGFSPLERDLDALVTLERELEGPDGLTLTESRFILEAQRPE